MDADATSTRHPARRMGGKMKVKPCTCGELPDLESSTYGWEAEERTSYYYRCPACGQRVGVWDSKQEALQEWNKAHL